MSLLPGTPHWKRQVAFYAKAETTRYHWLTQNPVVAQAEAHLLRRIPHSSDGGRMLEVGCGEGANLTTLRRLGLRLDYIGFDYFPDKIQFCRKVHCTQAAFLLADGRATFPFREGVFDLVLLRDVLHHVEAPSRSALLQESFRVLRTGGCLALVEGNVKNPVNLVYSLLLPHERLMLETSAPKLRAWLMEVAPAFTNQIEQWMEEPSTFFRFALHYRYGLPGLGRMGAVVKLLERLSRRCRERSPQQRWAYSVFKMVKRDVSS